MVSFWSKVTSLLLSLDFFSWLFWWVDDNAINMYAWVDGWKETARNERTKEPLHSLGLVSPDMYVCVIMSLGMNAEENLLRLKCPSHYITSHHITSHQTHDDDIIIVELTQISLCVDVVGRA